MLGAVNGRGTGFLPDGGLDLRGRAVGALRRFQGVGGPVLASHRLAEPRRGQQGGANACMGFGARQAAHLWLSARGLSSPDYSAWYAYWAARRHRVRRDEDVLDLGTSPSALVAAVNRYGLATTGQWGPTVATFAVNQPPPPMTLVRAQRARLQLETLYATSGARLDAIRRALSQDLPVLLAIPVDAAFTEDKGPSVIGPPRGRVGSLLHCVTLYGYSLDLFDVANSWGEQWRDGGNARLTGDLVEAAEWVGILRKVITP